jgi:hypothetical protein
VALAVVGTNAIAVKAVAQNAPIKVLIVSPSLKVFCSFATSPHLHDRRRFCRMRGPSDKHIKTIIHHERM